jgi:GR25 family glycosyltransferase involved in LPS biosynthesis
MKIYITHYTPLKDRKQKIIEQLNNYNLTNYEFIELYDRENLTSNEKNKFSNISLSEMSLFLKHIEIFKKEYNTNEYIIVLEDDAILLNNFKENLNTYINELTQLTMWNVAFTSSCCNLHVKNTIPSNHFYVSNSSRGTCMYIINIGTCKLLLNIYQKQSKIKVPIDHWFNNILTPYNLKYYWSEPVLIEQGSELGIYKSEIR